jgi:non-homologous end joining protein Ku
LAQLQPTDDKTIHLEHFLKPSFVDLVLFAGRSLYLLAANPAARRPFMVVARALDRSGK